MINVHRALIVGCVTSGSTTGYRVPTKPGCPILSDSPIVG